MGNTIRPMTATYTIKDRVSDFQRAPSYTFSSSTDDNESHQLYDFKHSFSISQQFVDSSNVGNLNTKATETFTIPDSGVTLELDLTGIYHPHQPQGFFEIKSPPALEVTITSEKQNVTFLNGQVFFKKSPSVLSLVKSFKSTQHFENPRKANLADSATLDGANIESNLNNRLIWLYYRGNLTFVFTGSVLVSTKSDRKIKIEMLTSKINQMPAIVAGSQYMLNGAEKSNVTLQIGEKKFPCHKAILNQRSKVFENMFAAANTQENQDGVVKIQDLTEDVLEEMIFFIYTDTSPKIKYLAKKLLIAADKYFLDKLKLMCELELTKQVNVKTACEICSVASEGNSAIVVSFTKDYIKRNLSVIKQEAGEIEIQKIPKLIYNDISS